MCNVSLLNNFKIELQVHWCQCKTAYICIAFQFETDFEFNIKE